MKAKLARRTKTWCPGCATINKECYDDCSHIRFGGDGHGRSARDQIKQGVVASYGHLAYALFLTEYCYFLQWPCLVPHAE
jgi:hypothetical protein